MNRLITDPEQIIDELTSIQNELEVTLSEDATEAVVRGNIMCSYMARTGKLLADAKHHRDLKLKSEVMGNLKKISALPASTMNKLIDALCHDENYIVDWAERVNRSCTHQVDWCRTLISKAKEEMRLQPSGNY